MIKKQYFSTIDKKPRSKQVHKSKFVDQQTSSDTPKKISFKSKFIDWLKQLPLDQRYLAVKVHSPGLANKIQQKLIQLENNSQTIDPKKDSNFNKKLSQKQSKQIIQSIVLITDGEQYFSNIGFDFIYIQNPQRLYDLLILPLSQNEKQSHLAQEYQPQQQLISLTHTLKQIPQSQTKQSLCVILLTYLRQQIIEKFLSHTPINLQQQRNRKKEFSTFWRSLQQQQKQRILLLHQQNIKSLQQKGVFIAHEIRQKLVLQSDIQMQIEKSIGKCCRVLLNGVQNVETGDYQEKKRGNKSGNYYQGNNNHNNVAHNNNKNVTINKIYQNGNHNKQHNNNNNIQNITNNNNQNKSINQKNTSKSFTSTNLLITSTNTKTQSNQQIKSIKKINININNSNNINDQKKQQSSKTSFSTSNTTNKRNKRNKNRGKKSNSAQSKQTKATSNKFTDQGQKQQKIVCQNDGQCQQLMKNNDNKIQDISQNIQNNNLQSKISISTTHSNHSTQQIITSLLNGTQQPIHSRLLEQSLTLLPTLIPTLLPSSQLLNKISCNIQQYSDLINQQANMYYDRRFIAYQRIQFMLNIWDIPIKLFGSCASGITIKNSDIDIAVDSKILEYFVNVPQTLRLKAALQQLSFFFTQQPFITSMKLISTASIPLIKMTLNTSLPFVSLPTYPIPFQYIQTMNRIHSSPGQIHIDLTIQTKNKQHQSNHLGVISTNWINKELSQIKTLHAIVIVIKNYLTMMGLNVTYQGGLNTYSMICMIVAYIKHNKLQNQMSIEMNLKKICYFYAYQFDQQLKGIDINNTDNIYYDKLPLQPKLTKSLTQSSSYPHNQTPQPKSPQLSHTKSTITFCQADLQIKDPLNNGKNMTKNCYSFPQIKKMFKKIYDECFVNYIKKIEIRLIKQCENKIKQKFDEKKNSISENQIKSFVQLIVKQCKDTVITTNSISNPFFTLFQ